MLPLKIRPTAESYCISKYFNKKKFWPILFFIIFQTFNTGIAASEVIAVIGENYGESLGEYLEYYADNKNLRFNEFRSSENSLPIIRNRGRSISAGFSDSQFWVRLTIRNDLPVERELLLHVDYALIDEVDAFIPDGTGNYRKFTINEDTPVYQRSIKIRDPLFRITMNAGETRTVYFRYYDIGAVPFTVRIWTTEVYLDNLARDEIILGIYYGIIIAIFFYNIFLFFSIRDISYLHYVLYLFTFFIFQLIWNGLAGQYLWPDTGVWWRNQSLIEFLLLFHIFFLLFSQSFLRAKKHVPLLNKIILPLIILAALQMAISPFLGFKAGIKIAGIYSMFSITLVVVIGAVAYYRGYRPAAYYLMGWSAILFGALLIWLNNFGILPSSFFSIYGFQLGCALEVILLSLGLADRYNELERKYLYANLKIHREREMFTREVHDTLGSQLTRTLLEVRSKPELKILENQISEILENTRDFTAILNMSDKSGKSFSADITNFFTGLNKLDKYSIIVDIDPAVDNLNIKIKMHTQRILQEWFSNSVRHGKATEFLVRLFMDSKNKKKFFYMVIENNGSPFTWRSITESADFGSGLKSIQHRIESLQARARAFSTSGGKNIFLMKIRISDT